MYYTYGALCALLLLSVGCVRDTSRQHGEKHVLAPDHIWTGDVPIPDQAKAKKSFYFAAPHDYQAAYTINQKDELVKDFYLKQMKQQGWELVWVMSGIETLLLFAKSAKHCAISIRPYSHGGSEIVILQKTALS